MISKQFTETLSGCAEKFVSGNDYLNGLAVSENYQGKVIPEADALYAFLA